MVASFVTPSSCEVSAFAARADAHSMTITFSMGSRAPAFSALPQAASGARGARLPNHIIDIGTQRLEGCADESRHLVARR
jgi:hypothetical protein